MSTRKRKKISLFEAVLKALFLTISSTLAPFFNYIKQQLKKLYIPGFQNLNVYQLLKFLVTQLNSISLYERASAISFNLLMALPASFLFLFSLIPYFPASFNVKKQILSIFKDISPDSSTYKFIVDIINDLLSQHVGIFSFGFLLLLFYASNAMTGIIRSFDKSLICFVDYLYQCLPNPH
jgi:membrane protein